MISRNSARFLGRTMVPRENPRKVPREDDGSSGEPAVKFLGRTKVPRENSAHEFSQFREVSRKLPRYPSQNLAMKFLPTLSSMYVS